MRLITIAVLYGYTLHIGGVESHLLSLFRNVKGVSWQVFAHASPEFKARAGSWSVSVINESIAHRFDVIGWFRFFRFIQIHHPDVIHIHSPNIFLPGVFVARISRIPCVLTIHLPAYYFVHGENPSARFKRGWYRWIERAAQILADRTIYVSSRVYEEARSLEIVTPARACLIENGVEIKADDVRGSPLTRHDVIVCCVGRLEYQKGADILLEAVSLLSQRLIDVRLIIIGDGNLQADLATMCESLGIQSLVTFTGFQTDVSNYLMASDIFVLPSRYETMSIALLEAMASSLPCIVTNVGENAQLITDGVEGFVVPPEDAEKLADALAKLVAAPDLRQRMGQAARIKVEQYSGERMAEKTFSLYQSLLK
ncbi:MAG: glycosyltransferase family 4 protein [Chloroflexi bacterium]|nr:glycosyltransferase family 4 protein [Chloroflexota bacterium]